VNMFGTVGQAIVTFGTEFLFGKLFIWLEKDLGGIIAKLGKALSDLFGGAAGAAGSAGGIASQVPGLPGASVPLPGNIPIGGAGGAGGAAGAAGAGIGGIVNVVTGAISAVSGVISNFQFYAMNKSLDLIVQHTLRIANQLIDGIQPQINAYLPKLKDLVDGFWDFWPRQIAYIQTLLEEGLPKIGGTINSQIIAPQLDSLSASMSSVDLKLDKLEDIRADLDVTNYYLASLAAESTNPTTEEVQASVGSDIFDAINRSINFLASGVHQFGKDSIALLAAIHAGVAPLDGTIRNLWSRQTTTQTALPAVAPMPDWFKLGIPSTPALSTTQQPIHVHLMLDGREVGNTIITAAQLQGALL
jgi:hypothetical protein